MKALTLLLAIFSISIIANANGSQEASLSEVKKAQIDQYVADYYQAKEQKDVLAFLNNKETKSHPPCNPGDYDSCLDTACSYLSKGDCDSANELKNISNQCRGNYNGDCIDAVCSHLRYSDCRNSNNMMQIISSCGGNYNGDCVRNICNRLPSHDCNSVNELTSIARSCARY